METFVKKFKIFIKKVQNYELKKFKVLNKRRNLGKNFKVLKKLETFVKQFKIVI